MAALTRIAIVTGAARGIGRSIALKLADDGLDVAVNDIAQQKEHLDEVVKEIEAKGRKAVAVIADVSKEEEVKAMIEKTVEVLGGVDCMIANAGIVRAVRLLDSDTESFDRTIAINLRGPMLCFKYAAQQMVKQGRGGRLIGASSAAGREGLPMLSAYSASKFGIRGLMQSAAKELAEHKITVNCYAPGVITTGIEISGSGADDFKAQGIPLPQHASGSSAPADVIASIVSYLCKPESYFITAQTISVDAGWVPS